MGRLYRNMKRQQHNMIIIIKNNLNDTPKRADTYHSVNVIYLSLFDCNSVLFLCYCALIRKISQMYHRKAQKIDVVCGDENIFQPQNLTWAVIKL